MPSGRSGSRGWAGCACVSGRGKGLGCRSLTLTLLLSLQLDNLSGVRERSRLLGTTGVPEDSRAAELRLKRNGETLSAMP